MHFDDLNLDKGYSPLKAYEQSKLANILFTKELAHKLKGIKPINAKLIAYKMTTPTLNLWVE